MLDGVCAYLDESVPEMRGDRVHFTARSGDKTIQVCMSEYAALTMAWQTIQLVDEAKTHRAKVHQFRGVHG